MLYKTIALELIQEQPKLYKSLYSSRRVLPAMDSYAADLRTRHGAWKEALKQDRPGSHPTQIESEALELAIEDLRGLLRSASQPTGAEPPSLDAAMSFIRRHTPPA